VTDGADGSAPGSRGRWRRVLGDLPLEVAVLTSIAFAVAIGFGIVAPVIPLYAREFGVGAALAGAVVSVFAAMRLVSALLGGRLVDRFDERSVLTVGLLIVAVSSLFAGAAQSYSQLLVMRGLGGVGSAMFTVSAFALMYRVVDPGLRGRAAGLIQGGFLLGGIAGPAFGGLLAEVSLRAPFFVYAGTLAVAAVISWWALRRAALVRVAGGVDGEAPRTTLRTALHSRAYIAALVTQLGTGWALFGIRSSLIPLFVADSLGLSARWVGIGFVVSAAVQGALLIPAGRFVDTVGRRPAMIGGGVVATVSIALLAVWPTQPAFLVSMALYGAGAALLGTAPAAVVGDVVGSRGGTVVAVSQMASDLGAIVGPLVAGLLVESGSYALAFGVTAGVVALGALVSTTMPETRRRPSSPGAAASADVPSNP
jgi:MFS family permease